MFFTYERYSNGSHSGGNVKPMDGGVVWKRFDVAYIQILLNLLKRRIMGNKIEYLFVLHHIVVLYIYIHHDAYTHVDCRGYKRKPKTWTHIQRPSWATCHCSIVVYIFGTYDVKRPTSIYPWPMRECATPAKSFVQINTAPPINQTGTYAITTTRREKSYFR